MRDVKAMKLLRILVLCSFLLGACSNLSSPTRFPPAIEPIAATAAPTSVLATSTPLPIPLVDRLDKYMQTDWSYFSGTILVAEKGENILDQGYGFADQEWDIPNTPQTKFAIGSMTKAFTAMAIMILQERGRLNVQDSICKYLSNCPKTWEPITLHHLLTHTSGIFNYSELDIWEKDKVNICREYQPDEVIAFFRDLPLDFEPGSSWKYSNSGYFLLGVVIEKVSGESYEGFIQQNILQPLEMSESGYDRLDMIVKHRASGYMWKDRAVNADCWDVSLKYAGGGLYSTVGDLYKWDQALYTNQLVSKDALNKIFTSYVSSQPARAGTYGYGWFLSGHSEHQVIEHSGAVFGFSSHIARYPENQVTIIVLSNANFYDPMAVSEGLASIVLGEE